MQQAAELIPLVFFFGTYFLKGHVIELGPLTIAFDGFMSATLVFMIATTVVAAAVWLKHRHLEKRLMFLTLIVLIMGSLTLLLNNSHFIMWKPTIFNWGISLALLGSRLAFKQSLMKLTLGKQLDLPDKAWWRLDVLWFFNCLIVGFINLYVAYAFSEAAWIAFKLYSSIGFTILISLATVAVIAPYMPHDKPATEEPR
ncbi:MAG: septation protein IspZ [Gammaproteobacteria bacterium]|nr:MAG: septation protein IspZ [Gammaproteobacteria bacterium]